MPTMTIPNDEEMLEVVKHAMRESRAVTFIPVEQVAITHKLSEIGVDSIAAVEVAALLEDRFAIRLPDDQLARVSSVRDLLTIVQRELRLAAA